MATLDSTLTARRLFLTFPRLVTLYSGKEHCKDYLHSADEFRLIFFFHFAPPPGVFFSFFLIKGVRRFDAAGKPLSGPFENPAVEARAVLEGQFMSMRLHSQTLGVRPNSITATGGASKNPVICQVLADVFGCPVKAAKTPDSAALGAAFRAKHAVACQAAGSFVPFATALGRDPAKEHRVVAQPNPKTKGVYDAMIER